jgi:hypothetical protein
MLVDVIQMRFQGTKLSLDELRAARPTRGILTVQTHTPGRINERGTAYATLTSARTSDALIPVLRDTSIRSLKGKEFVLHGFQTTAPPIGSSQTCPQAWWCKLVEDAEPVLVRPRQAVGA